MHDYERKPDEIATQVREGARREPPASETLLAGNRGTAELLGRPVQRLAGSDLDAIDGVHVAERIGAAESSGSDLDSALHARVTDALGADPGPVRVHTDAEADDLSQAVGAMAFTSGRDVFFRDGAFDPASPKGFELLVHESTHVLQQAAGPVAGTPTADGAIAISDPSDSFEQAASSNAAQLPEIASASGSRSVQRQVAPDDEDRPDDELLG